MKNEIGIFRGRRVDNGEWVEGFRVFYDVIYPPTNGCSVGTADMSAECHFRCNAIRVDQSTIGMSVGREINGRQVFEGDLFYCSRYDLLLFINSSLKLRPIDEDDERRWCAVCEHMPDNQLRFIGTVHDYKIYTTEERS